ncbi:MAG TPA: hypothetical protein VJW17_16910 [Pyrinomonadaceae bacterium]|nr:hypothetical protein [Pyrinomonadaceae bacterium]
MPAGILEVIVVANKNPLPILRWQRVWNRFVLCLVCVCEHREHDRQPATAVVVTPVTMMAVIDIPKHCSAAYT